MSSRLNDFMNLFYFISRLFNAKLFIYTTISRDNIEMKNLSNGKTIKAKAEKSFSSERLLVADNIIIEKMGKEMLEEICGKGIKTKQIFLLIQPIEKGFEKVYPVEKMILNDFGHVIGASYVYIIQDSLTKLNNIELDKIIKSY